MWMNKFSVWLTLSMLKGVGSKTIKRLYEQVPHLDEQLLQDEQFLNGLTPRYKKLLTCSAFQRAKEKAQQLQEQHDKQGITVIAYDSEYYPFQLRLIADPPMILYIKGNKELLKNSDMLAVVGTRKPSTSGLEEANEIAAHYAKQGYIIVSGLALGVDTAAHQGALKTGQTIAVLAGNLSAIYPATNQALAEVMLENGGLLLSEMPLHTKSIAGHFVKRNRIQSGLSLGVCAIEAGEKSGTQHTIQYALQEQRYLFMPSETNNAHEKMQEVKAHLYLGKQQSKQPIQQQDTLW